MNSNEYIKIVTELEKKSYHDTDLISLLSQSLVIIQKLQQERDLLFKAHSHEMSRADELQIECSNLQQLNKTYSGVLDG